MSRSGPNLPKTMTGVVPYAELHYHSNFSFLDGVSPPEDLGAPPSDRSRSSSSRSRAATPSVKSVFPDRITTTVRSTMARGRSRQPLVKISAI